MRRQLQFLVKQEYSAPWCSTTKPFDSCN